ncbi:unnamed protein product [Rotaria sp. Silwood2]|nr:unnamed protein product [Rotaria sp. Silwood2]CAF2808017.1 unnamed protein product [Rotaria sp. Silwood2]CAF4249797.1 unnamed protein product [Rotaria sp. Silwood2]CAF4339658.1 unnamed protein product [Rotaria sp. Silwood2]
MECNESVAHSSEFQQHSFAKKSFSKYHSNNEQNYSTNLCAVQHMVSHVPLGPISSYYDDHGEILHMGVTVMIMAPEKYKEIVKTKMLFEPFPIPYKSTRDELLNEILKQSRVETDKSGQLDEDECSIALLTLFKYIDDGQNSLNADILLPIAYEQGDDQNSRDANILPIVYKQGDDQNNEYYTERDFRTLIIDTLAEHIRIHTFDYPNDPKPPSIRNMSKRIERISNRIEKIRTDDLHRSSNESPNPFSLKRILQYIGLFVLYIFGLPVVVFRAIFKNYPKNNIKGKNMVIQHLLIILLSIIGALVACIIYLIIVNVALFHIFHDDNVDWHVSSLEAYWPFALMIGIVCIVYIYRSPFEMKSDYRKNQQLQENYDEAELDFLKHKAVVNMPEPDKYQSMTVAELERIQGNSTVATNEFNENLNNQLVKKVRKGFIDFCRKQEKNSWWMILLQVVGLIVVLGIAVARACVPTIYRKYNREYTYPNTTKPFQVELINDCYYVFGLPLYFIYLLMIVYGYYLYYGYYNKLKHVLQQPTNNNEYNVARKSDNKYYLDLRRQYSLELFIVQLRHVTKRKDKLEYQLAMASIGGGVIFTLILGVVAIVQLIYYQPGGLPTLTTLLGIIDMGIMMVLVIIFLFNVVVINTALANVEVLLLRTKKEAFVQSTKRTTLNKDWNIEYLSAVIEQFSADMKSYAVTVFGFVIDKSLVFKVASIMIGSLASHLMLFLKKKSKME